MNLIDEFFLEANPNPERVGCPPEETIRLLAASHVPADHPARAHLATCSECYAEYRAFKLDVSAPVEHANEPWKVASSSPDAGEGYIPRSAAVGMPPLPAPVMPARTDAVLDHGVAVKKPVSPEQDKASEVLDLSGERQGLSLPVGLVSLKVILPSTQGFGAYRLLFAQRSGDVNAEFQTAGALMREGDLSVVGAFVDLRQFRPGAATLTLLAAFPENSEIYTVELT